MIRAVAFCPMAPVLVPQVAQGAAPELDDVRDACRQAILRANAPGRRWLVLGPGPVSRSFAATSRGTLAGFGLPLELGLGSDEPGPLELPLSLTIGAWLLRDALGPGCGARGWSVARADDPELVGWHDADEAGRDHALLAMGEGSARRTVKAPGYLDERAEPFDSLVAGALAAGESGRLRTLRAEHDLLSTGTEVWSAVGAAVEPGTWAARLLYDAAPYGVGYFVASWLTDG